MTFDLEDAFCFKALLSIKTDSLSEVTHSHISKTWPISSSFLNSVLLVWLCLNSELTITGVNSDGRQSQCK